MRARTWTAFATLAALLAWPLAGHAADLTVTVASSRDATLYGGPEEAGLANGAGRYVFAGHNNAKAPRRALVAFDLGAFVPPGSTIKSAVLRMTVSRTSEGETVVDVHRVTAGWNESTTRASGGEGGGARALDGDPTWSHRVWPDTPWTKPGGDFFAMTSATKTVPGEGPVEWTSAELADDVQRWAHDPATNFGWILVAEGATANGSKRFGAHEGARAERPQLVVTFAPPAGAIGACCPGAGACGYVVDGSAACAGLYRGAGSVCAEGTCPPPTAACCRPDTTAACSVLTEAACVDGGGNWREAQPTCAGDPCPVVVTPFVDELPRLPVATPIDRPAAGPVRYRLAAVQSQQKLHRDLPPTTVWGFTDGKLPAGYLGPTIEARIDQPVSVTWANDLRDAAGVPLTTHSLAVDSCPHGAETSAPRTVVHLHGGHVPAAFDGQPDQTALPGEQAVYQYPNHQRAATLWYHDHALGITRLNVIMGLAGMYLLRDAAEDALGLPKGDYEVPLLIQDRSFHPDGRFKYPADWEETFFGDTILVNGKAWPFLKVDRGLYRLRVLNGSSSRTYTVYLRPFAPIVQIGGEGGLLPAGVTRTGVTMGPGERLDLIVDFSRAAAGDEFVLRNEAAAPYPNGDDANIVRDVMKFVVGPNAGHVAPLPASLRPVERLDPASATLTRDFVLARKAGGCGGGSWGINGLGYHDVTDRPRLGTTEIWRFINQSGIAHPMHPHLSMFQVLDRQPFKVAGGVVETTGPAKPPDLVEMGWKDTVLVKPFEIVRVIMPFEDYAGHFPFHCHLLEHEDHDMMRQFEALPECNDGGCPDGGDGGAPDGPHQHDAATEDGAHHGGDAGSGAEPSGPPFRGGCGCDAVGAATAPGAGTLAGLAFTLALVAGSLAARARSVTGGRLLTGKPCRSSTAAAGRTGAP